MSLGLVESKRAAATPAADRGAGIDPDAKAPHQQPGSVILRNPHVSMDQVREEWAKAWTNLQNYKYNLSVTKKRLHLGSQWSVRNHSPLIRWMLYTEDEDPVTKKIKVKMYKRIEQRVIGFVREDPADGSPIVTLRPRAAGKTLQQEFLELVAASGIDVQLLQGALTDGKEAGEHKAGSSAADPPAPTPEELKAAEEARQKAEAEAEEKRKAEEEAEAKRKAEEEAAKRPLRFSLPPAFEQLDLERKTALVLGDLSEADLLADLQNDLPSPKADYAAAAAAEPVQIEEQEPLPPPEPTAEEMNAIGAQLFKADEVHEQSVAFYDQIVEHFKATVAVLVKQSGGSKVLLQSTIFLMNDLQNHFETSYKSIDGLKETIVHVFPVVQIGQPNQPHSLWIKSYTTDEQVYIDQPSEFSIVGHMQQKSGLGYIFHKCKLNSTDARAIRAVASTVDKLVHRLIDIVNQFRQRRGDDSTTPAAAATAVHVSTPPVQQQQQHHQAPAVVTVTTTTSSASQQQQAAAALRIHRSLQSSSVASSVVSRPSSSREDNEELF